MPDRIPTCHTCGAPAMPNTRECSDHWRLARGWNVNTLDYDDPLPFEAGAEDEGWTDEAEACQTS
jgi:hypothetical protein